MNKEISAIWLFCSVLIFGRGRVVVESNNLWDPSHRKGRGVFFGEGLVILTWPESILL